MNLFLQVFLGALPVFIALVIYLVKKRKLLLPAIVFGAEFIFMTALIAANAPKTITETDAIGMYQAYNAMGRGDYSQAAQSIGDAFVKGAEKLEITLAKARLYLAEGALDEAVILYEKVQDKDGTILDKSEKKLVESIKSGAVYTAKDLSYIRTNASYLKEQKLDPKDYGFEEISQKEAEKNIEYLDSVKNQVVPEIIKEELENMEEKYPVLGEVDNIDKVVDKVVSDSEFSQFSIADTGDIQNQQPADTEGDNTDDPNESNNKKDREIEKLDKIDPNSLSETELKQYHEFLSKKLEEYKDEYPELFQEDKYVEAYVLSKLLAGEKLDTLLDDDDDRIYEIISSLYMSGIVTEEDFSDEFVKEYREIHKKVYEHCVEIGKDLADEKKLDTTFVDGESVKDVINQLKEKNDFALERISTDMEEMAESETVEADRLTDVYMTLAAIESVRGNTGSAIEFFNQAVDNSKKSSNAALSKELSAVREAYEEGETDSDYNTIAEGIARAYEDKFYYDLVSENTAQAVKSVAGSAVSQNLAKVSIGKIDVSEFPKIKVSIQYSGEDQLTKKMLKLKDCGIDIEDYEINKKNYDSSEVILLCDVSGSMDDSLDQLREAVTKYVNSKTSKEKINIVPFSSSILKESGFMSDRAKLVEYAGSEIYGGGGTAAAQSCTQCINEFTEKNSAKTVILMTDGEDNVFFTDNEIKEKIGRSSENNNVTVYTIGLSDGINQEYLEKIAEAGGGEFIYCSDTSVLDGAYDFIHKRIENEYEITFEAEDLDSISRVLDVEVSDDSGIPAKDSKKYSLKEDSVETNDDAEFSTVLPKGVTITGLSVDRINKSSERQFVEILGQGFKNVNVSAVFLESADGNSNCKIKNIEDDKIKFQVAPNVKDGVYSVFVTINGKKYKAGQLTVGNVNSKEFVFGPYRFKADYISKDSGTTVLSGNVSLNDYLYFSGDVYITGNEKTASQITVKTDNSAYVHHDTASYSVLDKILCGSNSKSLAFTFINVDLYDDGANYNNYEDYKVSSSTLSEGFTSDIGIVSFEGGKVNIYPDRVMQTTSAGFLKDNTITDLLTNGVEFFKTVSDKIPLSFEKEMSVRLMKEGPFTYLNTELSYDDSDEDAVGTIKFADFLAIDGKFDAKVMFDTYKREFEFGLTLDVDNNEASPNKSGNVEYLRKGSMGATISLKGEKGNERNGDKFLNIEVALPLELTFYVEGVPVTVTDIKCSLENYNISAAIKQLVNGNMFTNQIKQYLANKEGADLKVSGNVELISTAALPDKVSSVIKKWLGDNVSLLSAEDIYGSVGINYPHFACGLTLKALGMIELSKIDMELGAISYPDYVTELLNVNGSDRHYGITVTSKTGISFDWDLVGSDISGTVSGVTTFDKFLISAYAKGTLAAKAKVSIFGTGFEVDGETKAEACAGVWKKGSDWNVSAIVVVSVDGTAGLKLFGQDILEKEIHERYEVVDESKTF